MMTTLNSWFDKLFRWLNTVNWHSRWGVDTQPILSSDWLVLPSSPPIQLQFDKTTVLFSEQSGKNLYRWKKVLKLPDNVGFPWSRRILHRPITENHHSEVLVGRTTFYYAERERTEKDERPFLVYLWKRILESANHPAQRSYGQRWHDSTHSSKGL